MDAFLRLQLRLYWPTIKDRWHVLRGHADLPVDVRDAGDRFEQLVDAWLNGV